MRFLQFSNQFFKLLTVISTLFFSFIHPYQFCWGQLMVVKHVFLFPAPFWLSLFLSLSYSPHSFLLLLLHSQGGINSMLRVYLLSFFFIHPSFFTPSHAIDITLCIHYLTHPSPPHASSLHAAKCTWSMCLSVLWLSLCTLYSQLVAHFVVHLLSLLPFLPSLLLCTQWAISVACGLSLLHLNYTYYYKGQPWDRERERDSNRHCLLDPSNHGLHTVIM